MRIHNDIKLDNIVPGANRTGELKPYVIDFGKARRIDGGKMYTLSESERQPFKLEHTSHQILGMDFCTSIATDIYSYGSH